MKVKKELWEERKRPKGTEVERRAMEYMTWEQGMGLFGRRKGPVRDRKGVRERSDRSKIE